MPNPVLGIAAASAGSTALAARSQRKAAESASNAQSAAAAESIAEQRRQFDEVQRLLEPFVANGRAAMSESVNLLGLRGPEAQATALDAVERGPELQALIDQGEDAILANASATGGLRGGNVQGALAQFRPQMFSEVLNRRYDRLGGLTSLGQSAASRQATAAENLGQGVSQQLNQQGAAQAGNALAAGRAQAQTFGGLGQSLGTVFGAGIPSGGIPQGQNIFSRWGF